MRTLLFAFCLLPFALAAAGPTYVGAFKGDGSSLTNLAVNTNGLATTGSVASVSAALTTTSNQLAASVSSVSNALDAAKVNSVNGVAYGFYAQSFGGGAAGIDLVSTEDEMWLWAVNFILNAGTDDKVYTFQGSTNGWDFTGPIHGDGAELTNLPPARVTNNLGASYRLELNTNVGLRFILQ